MKFKVKSLSCLIVKLLYIIILSPTENKFSHALQRERAGSCSTEMTITMLFSHSPKHTASHFLVLLSRMVVPTELIILPQGQGGVEVMV